MKEWEDVGLMGQGPIKRTAVGERGDGRMKRVSGMRTTHHF